MLGVGDSFPEFKVKAVVSADPKTAFKDIENETYKDKWKVFLFYPKDFTFVCPTELKGFGEKDKDFKARGAQILAGSTDSEYVHLAWRTHEPDLKDLPYPMLADIKRELCASLGILDLNAGVAQRAVFIVDPKEIIRFVYTTDFSVGRSPQEVLRVLDALQTGELCPCNWKKGDKTLS